MFFNLAIKYVATYIRDIYLKCNIFKEILGFNLSFFYYMYIINQKRKRIIVNHFTSPFYHFHQSCTCIYIKDIMWIQAGNDAAETKKKTKMRVVVHCRNHICSEINRCLDNILQNISIKIDNLHKLYFKFTQRSVFIKFLTIFVHFCIFKRNSSKDIYLHKSYAF